MFWYVNGDSNIWQVENKKEFISSKFFFSPFFLCITHLKTSAILSHPCCFEQKVSNLCLKVCIEIKRNNLSKCWFGSETKIHSKNLHKFINKKETRAKYKNILFFSFLFETFSQYVLLIFLPSFCFFYYSTKWGLKSIYCKNRIFIATVSLQMQDFKSFYFYSFVYYCTHFRC